MEGWMIELNPFVHVKRHIYSRAIDLKCSSDIEVLRKRLCRNEHEQSVRTQTMKIAQNEIFFVGSKD